MMTPDKFQLVVHYVMVISIENFVETRAQIRHPSYGNQSQSNVREIYHTSNLSRNHPRESRTSTDIPVSFKAPDVGSQNFWNYHNNPGSSNRRTFLGDLGYLNYGKTNPFPNLNSFFEFMNPFVDKGNDFRPLSLPQAVTKSVSEPYRYEYPYNFVPTTERHFLPPPKPIRASIVKLETITRSPGPFEYFDSPRDLPNFSNLKPIPAVKPVSLYIDELGFHPGHNMNFREDPSWNSRPKEFSTTHFINNISSTIYIPSSAEVHQQSIKVVPYAIQELLINDENGTDKRTLITKEKPTSKNETGNITLSDNDSSNKDSQKSFGKAPQHETKEHDEKGLRNAIKSQNSTTVLKYKESDSGAAKESEGATSIQNTRSYRRGNSIKIVTELTLEGLSKNNKTANIPRYPKVINMSGLISYELNKLKRNKFLRPRSDDTEEKEESFSHSLANRSFTGDVLSLDLKILKDTNWDGFTTEDSPRKELMGAKTTEGGGSLDRPNSNPVIDFSYDPNKGNSSKANYTATTEGKHDNNKTIIVETRVTKSISKVLPPTHRQTYKKLRGTNKGGETLRNIIKQITLRSNDLRNQSSEKTDLKSGIESQTTEQTDYYPPDITTVYEASNTSQSAELYNETIVTAGKHLNGFKDNGLTHNMGRYNFTRRSRNGIHGNVSERLHDSLEDVSEETPVDSTTTEVKQDFYLENKSSQPEKVNTSNVTTPQPDTQNETGNIEVKNTRKRKYKKRQKIKRRRTGKRRQKIIATTEESIGNLTISEKYTDRTISIP